MAEQLQLRGVPFSIAKYAAIETKVSEIVANPKLPPDAFDLPEEVKAMKK